jgi:glycosyltransferase involved in cell wall biosynthesis
MGKSTPQVLAILPGFMPSTLMCVVRPFLGLQKAQQIRCRMALEAYFDIAALQWADLVVFCRNVEPRYEYILDAVLASHLPHIYDIDDNLFDVPTDSADGLYYRAPERKALLTRYLSSASLVRVYSPALFEKIQPINEHTLLVPAVLDWRLIRPRRASRGNKVKIVYATSRRDDHLFPLFTPALQQVMKEYEGRVEAHFLGFQPAEFQGKADTYYRKYSPNYDQYLRNFSRAGYDIGLAPMLDDDFHRAKTNNKFREYAASGIAGIYSNVPLYSAWVENGKTGLLVDNRPEAWYTAMVQLIEDLSLRRQISQIARDRVHELYSEEEFEQQWSRQIQSVLSRPAPRLFTSGGPTALVVESTAVPENQIAPSRMKIFRIMLQRGVALVRIGELRRSFFNLRFHLENLWWLFKINRFKRL